MSSSSRLLRQQALQTGLYLGAVSVVISTLSYLFDEEQMLNQFSSWRILSLVLTLGLCIYRGRQSAKICDLSRYEFAYKYSFIALFLGMFINAVWMMLIVHLVEPGMIQHIMNQAALEMEQQLAEYPEAEESIQASMKAMHFFLSPLGMLLGSVIGGAFWSGVLSLLVALGVRRSSNN